MESAEEIQYIVVAVYVLAQTSKKDSPVWQGYPLYLGSPMAGILGSCAVTPVAREESELGVSGSSWVK